MHRTSLIAAVLAPAMLFVAVPTVLGQANTNAAPPSQTASPRDLARTRAEFVRVRNRMEEVQRDFDRAARTNDAALRDTALKDWRRALDGLVPYVKELSAEVPEEQRLIAQLQEWEELYAQAADPALAGAFFLQMSKDWTELSAGTEGWDQEAPSLTFEQLTKAEADDASAKSLGMPKTVAFVTAVNAYVDRVVARPEYLRFKADANVKNDLTQVEVARGQAFEKLAHAADVLLTSAESAKLDQNSRDRLERFVEEDLAAALDGSQAQAKAQTRGRKILYAYDKANIGNAEAIEKSKTRMTAAADKAWPRIVARYAAQPMAPKGAGRGQVVTVTGARNLIGSEFGVQTYDFGGYIDGAPAVANFAPGVREQVNETLALMDAKSLPADATYDFVAVIRGTAQVPNVRRPGVTTAPAIADDATAATSPAVTDCVLLEIVALKAGPVAVGTAVEVMPER